MSDKEFSIKSLFSRFGQSWKQRRGVIVVLFVAYFLSYFIILITQQEVVSLSGYNSFDFKLDEVAPYDFIVRRDNITYKDEKASKEKRDAAMKLVSPIFSYKADIGEKGLKKFDRFYEHLAESVQDRNSLEMIQAGLQFNFPEIHDLFGKNEISAMVSLFPDQVKEVFSHARRLLAQCYDEGIFYELDNLADNYPSFATTGNIEVLRARYQVGNVSLDRAITLSNLQDWIENKTKAMILTEMNKSLVILLVTAFAEENCFFEQKMTEDKRDQAMEKVGDVILSLQKGEIIVPKGFKVTQENLDKIRAHGESDISLNINLFLGTALFLLVIFAMAIFLFKNTITNMEINEGQVYLIVGISVVYLLLAAIFSKVPWESEWLPYSVMLPTSSIAMWVTILISPNAGFVLSLVISLLLLPITGMDVGAFLFAFLTGVAGSVAALKTEKRIDLIRSGLYLSIFGFLVLLMQGYVNNFNGDEFMPILLWGLGNGFFCGILSLGFLPILEFILNSPTRFRLMELSNLNSPIFKKMLTLAPGTYNHSVFIANLAESVCHEIGADPLLARVGAYYHDIGKIDQAEYFIENQRSGNKHDELKPTLSAAIIKSHVKIGIEKAKELNLPREVVDIIAQHHGKGLIAYFYQRAISENKNMNIASSDFSYNSSRPQTKEAAVVMLADVVEAASRTLRRPTMGKLEKFIWNIIFEKFNSGELSESNLTLNDLERIKNKFVQIMAGHFHSRIEYPKIREGVK